MDNRYFQGKLPNSEMAQVYKVIVANSETIAKCPNSKDIVVKLHLGDKDTHACLNSFKEIMHQQAKEIVSSWYQEQI